MLLVESHRWEAGAREAPGMTSVPSKPRRSCLACRKRHLKCELRPSPKEPHQFSCVWCIEHGVECQQIPVFKPPTGPDEQHKDWLRVINRFMSGFGGFRVPWQPSTSPASEVEDPDVSKQQAVQLEAPKIVRWQDSGTNKNIELELDNPVEDYLLHTFFESVQPYIPIITKAHIAAHPPSPLLRAAIYGVTSRLPNSIVSSRDFAHIKRVLQYELDKLMADYSPSLDSCQALALANLTLELHSDGPSGLDAWSLRLSAAIRMALELQLHREETYASSGNGGVSPELKRRLFWSLLIKERWSGTSGNYPLIIDMADVNITPPSPLDLDTGGANQHEFFCELVQQTLVLSQIHSVVLQRNRALSGNTGHIQANYIPLEDFQIAKEAIDSLRINRMAQSQDSWRPETRAHIELIHTCLQLFLYAPFLQTQTAVEFELFTHFFANIAATRVPLATSTVESLGFASVPLLYTGPSIWGITMIAQVNAFLVALAVKHAAPTYAYDSAVVALASQRVESAVEMAQHMTVSHHGKRWGVWAVGSNLMMFAFRAMSEEGRQQMDTNDPVFSQRLQKPFVPPLQVPPPVSQSTPLTPSDPLNTLGQMFEQPWLQQQPYQLHLPQQLVDSPATSQSGGRLTTGPPSLQGQLTPSSVDTAEWGHEPVFDHNPAFDSRQWDEFFLQQHSWPDEP